MHHEIGSIAPDFEHAFRTRMLTLRMRAKPVLSVDQHQAIIDAVAEGDAAQARRHARDYRTRARDELIPLLVHLKIRHL